MKRIVYVNDGVLPLRNTEIYVANVDGTGVRRLTNYDGARRLPRSPDGTKVLFTRGVTFRAQDVLHGRRRRLSPREADPDRRAARDHRRSRRAAARAGRVWAIVVLVDDARGLPVVNATRICAAQPSPARR